MVHILEWGFMWGGIPTSIISLIKEFNEYEHYVLQLNQRVNPQTVNFFKNCGANYIIIGAKLKNEHLDSIKPDLIFIHSCNKTYIKANLNKYKTVTLFHYNIEDNNDYHGDLNWFISKYTYDITKNKPQNYIIQPPPCYVSDFLNIKRSNRKPIVGRIQSLSLIKNNKFSKKFFELLKKIDAEVFIVGPKESNASIIPGKMPEYLKNIDLFLIWGDTTETWSLVTTEANLSGIPVVARKMNDGLSEQLKKSGGGVLVSNENDFLDVVDLLIKDETLRKIIGERGKNWCIENVSTKQIRSYLEGWLDLTTYEIHKKYVPRRNVEFLNTENKTDQFQDDVYKKAFEIVQKNNYNKIIDFGCGSGYKLIKYFDNYTTRGYDLKQTVDFLKTKYPDKDWWVSDFSSPPTDEGFDLVICADVIEHLENPDKLINWLLTLNIKKIIISTSNRDLLVKNRNHSNYGPPENKHHFREWGFDEFNNYLSKSFKILEHYSIEEECNQVVVCEKK